MAKEYHYFVSDVHLGLEVNDPLARERRFVELLRSLPAETASLYLLGDIFDFWFEYKHVVPRGHVRTLGALAELADRGVKIYHFKGNHDMWTFGYLKEQMSIETLVQPHYVTIGEKIFCLGHGDGLDKSDRGYLFLKAIFNNRLLQRVFGFLHPFIGFSIAHKWSKHNRLAKGTRYKFKGSQEPLYLYAAEQEQVRAADYFIFGHIHSPGEIVTPLGATMYILGEWINGCEYLVYESVSGTMEWRSGYSRRAE